LARVEISHYASYKKSAKVIDSDIPELNSILHPRVTSGERIDSVLSCSWNLPSLEFCLWPQILRILWSTYRYLPNKTNNLQSETGF